MNIKVVRNFLSRLLVIESMLMLLPVLVGFIYQESFEIIGSFLITIIIILVFSFVLYTKKNNKEELHTKEGMVIVAATWILWSIFGGLPFVISGQINSFVDAVFEMASGFTTTGASIINDLEAISYAHLFWRSFSHFIGGMGVLVFALVFRVHLKYLMRQVQALLLASWYLDSSDSPYSLYLYWYDYFYNKFYCFLGMSFLTQFVMLLFCWHGGFSTYNESIGYLIVPILSGLRL